MKESSPPKRPLCIIQWLLLIASVSIAAYFYYVGHRDPWRFIVCGVLGLICFFSILIKASEYKYDVREYQEELKKLEQKKATVSKVAPPRIPKFNFSYLGDILTNVYNDVHIAGCSYCTDMPEIVIGDYVDFEAEPNNEHDVNAIMATVKKKKIGYIGRGALQDLYHTVSERGGNVAAYLINNDPKDLKMNIAFYDKPKYHYDRLIASNYERKIFDLIGTDTLECQDNLVLSKVGDFIPVKHLDKKGKIAALESGIVYSDNPIGFFPKPLEIYAVRSVGFMTELDSDAFGIFTVKAALFPVPSYAVINKFTIHALDVIHHQK